MPLGPKKTSLNSKIVIEDDFIGKQSHGMGRKTQSVIVPSDNALANDLPDLDEDSKDDFAIVSEETDGMTKDKYMML